MDSNDRAVKRDLLKKYEEHQRTFRVNRRESHFTLPGGESISFETEECNYETEDGARVTESQSHAFFADCGHTLKAKADVGRICSSCGRVLCAACADMHFCGLCRKPVCSHCTEGGWGTEERYCSSCVYLHRLFKIFIGPIIFLLNAFAMSRQNTDTPPAQIDDGQIMTPYMMPYRNWPPHEENEQR